MYSRRTGRETELTAILLAPNRALAENFLATVPGVRGFQILAELSAYPTQQTLDIRLRQLQPDVALVDLSTDLERASEIIRVLVSQRPPIPVVGLHTHNDSEVILRAVRQGVSEFLYAPFDPEIQREAIARLERLRQPDSPGEPEMGRMVVFSSAKPGAGSSTLATQTAFALKRATGKRILLADFDLVSGTIGFYLKLNQRYSLADLLHSAAEPSSWPNYTVTCGGVDILTAPEKPYTGLVEPARFQEILHSIRYLYDWIVVDLPVVFHRISLLALSQAEKSFLVSTTELPSLHLTRKALSLLTQVGFGKDRIHVVVNRFSKKDDLGGTDMARLFECPVHATFPNDYFSLHRVITLGRPLTNDCELGQAIENLAAKISGAAAVGDKKRAGGALTASPALSET
ncbi:MAG: P-loop NTPase [Bryobacteraceae bacterium]|nr:P-loop NTPase [Bryobacteraceae bacterium]